MVTAQEPASIVNEIARRLNDNTRRIRVFEERLRNLDRRVNSLENNVSSENKKTHEDLQKFDVNLKEIRDRVANIDIDIQNFKKELKKLIRKREVKELQSYIELINPITSKYVTRKEVEEMIKAKE